MTEATSMVLTGGGLGVGLVAGHRCPEVGAWNQGEPMWIGIVGFWRGIWVRHLITIMWTSIWRWQNFNLKMTEYSTLPPPPSDPRARVPERDDRRRGSSHLYRGRTGSSSLLPFRFSWLWFGPKRAGLGICCLRFFGYFSQVKVFTESTFMELAVEQFLGKSEEDVKVGFW